MANTSEITVEQAAAALREFNVVSQVTEEDLRAQGIGSSLPKLGRSRAYRLIYWRKPPVENSDGRLEPGDIVFGGAWDSEFTKNMALGWTPLTVYGHFQDFNPDEPGGPWSPSKDKYRRLLRHPMGPQEMTLRQVMEICAGDIRKLPKGVHFPQLETEAGKEALAGRQRCNMCGVWRRNEHLLYNHQQIKHKSEAAVDKQSRSLASAITLGNEPQNEMAKSIAAAVEQQGQMISQQGKLLESVMAQQAEQAKTVQGLLQYLVGQKDEEKKGPGRPKKDE